MSGSLACAGKEETMRRRWRPIRAIRSLPRATAKGLSRAVSAPVKRMRNRRGASSAAASITGAAMSNTSSSLLLETSRAGVEELGQALQGHVDRISSELAGGLARMFPAPKAESLVQRASSDTKAAQKQSNKYRFPQNVCDDRGSCRALAATGSRTWGSWWDGRGLLNLRIYDFAIYVDSEKLRHSRMSRRFRHKRPAQLRDDYYQSLRSSTDFGMSLLVRTNHALPIGMMSREYERILRKRMSMVGGDSQDPHLNAMLEYFKEPNLPDHVKWGRNTVRKGTVLTFHRMDCGGLEAKANHELLGAVPSRDVSAALFDLYLGSNPVHPKAKRATGRAVLDLMSSQGIAPAGGAAEVEAAEPRLSRATA